MTKIAEHENIEIHETHNGYEIYFVNPNDPNGTLHVRGLEDGADMYGDVSPGTPELNRARTLQEDLESDYWTIMEAYGFDRVFPR